RREWGATAQALRWRGGLARPSRRAGLRRGGRQSPRGRRSDAGGGVLRLHEERAEPLLPLARTELPERGGRRARTARRARHTRAVQKNRERRPKQTMSAVGYAARRRNLYTRGRDCVGLDVGVRRSGERGGQGTLRRRAARH